MEKEVSLNRLKYFINNPYSRIQYIKKTFDGFGQELIADV